MPIYNKRRKNLKTLKELTLLSKFLFDETMDMPEAHEAALRILLDDGAVRIFLNTRGTNENEISQELADFLHYIERTDEQSALASGSENIRKIHECVKQIKSSDLCSLE